MGMKQQTKDRLLDAYRKGVADGIDIANDRQFVEQEHERTFILKLEKQQLDGDIEADDDEGDDEAS